MAYLLDTGILLRLVNTQDRLHGAVLQALSALATQRKELFTTTQNAAEFWNVATRPLKDNGLELPAATTLALLEKVIEPTCTFLTERDTSYDRLKQLVVKYEIKRKHVHDARLVALMLSWKIDKILTRNDRDFRRYEPEGITVVYPDLLLGGDTAKSQTTS